MADRLNGYRILILETREEAQFSRLLGEQAGKLRFFARFQDQDAVTVQSVSHDQLQRFCFALCSS